MGLPCVFDFSEPCGTVALSGTYGFAALGMLAGFGLASLPGVSRELALRPNVMRSLIALGAMLTSALVLTCLLKSDLLASSWFLVTGAPRYTPLCELLSKNGTLTRLVIATSSCHEPLILISCCLCALAGYATNAESTPSKQAIRPTEEQPWSRDKLLLGILAVSIGLIRGWAWIPAMPHGRFPLNVPDGVLSAEDLWVQVVSPAAIIPFGITFAIAAIATAGRHGGQNNDARPCGYVLPQYCAGVVTGSCLLRLCPELHAAAALASYLCLAAQLLLLAITAALSVRLNHEPSNYAEREANLPIGPARPLPQTIDKNDLEVLQTSGLTQIELFVLEAAAQGLTSSEASNILGIAPSTARAYRAKISTKLGEKNIESVLLAMARRTGAFASSADHEETPLHGKKTANPALAALGTSGIYGSLIMVLLPYGNAAWTWEFCSSAILGVAYGLAFLATPTARHVLRAHDTAALRISAMVYGTCIVGIPGVLGSIVTPLPVALRIATAALYAGCTSGGIVCGTRCMRSLASNAGEARQNHVVCMVLIGLLCSLAVLGHAGWTISLALATLFGVTWAIFGERGTDAALIHQSQSPAPHTTPALLPLVAILAFSWEEAWRNQSFVAFEIPCAICISIVLVGYVIVCHSRKPQGCKTLTYGVAAVSCIVVGIIKGPFFALLLGTCLLPIAELGASAEDTRGPSSAPAYLLAAVCGIGVGLYLGDLYGSTIAGNTAIKLGGSAPFSLFVEGALTFALGCLTLFSVSALYASSHMTSPLAHPQITERRLRGYFASKGIDGLGEETLVLLANGMSVAEAASHLGYERATIDAARRKGFLAIGVKNRAEFYALLHRELGR